MPATPTPSIPAPPLARFLQTISLEECTAQIAIGSRPAGEHSAGCGSHGAKTLADIAMGWSFSAPLPALCSAAPPTCLGRAPHPRSTHGRQAGRSASEPSFARMYSRARSPHQLHSPVAATGCGMVCRAARIRAAPLHTGRSAVRARLPREWPGSRAGFAEAPAPRKQAPPAPRRGAPSHTRQTARPRTVPHPLPRPASTRQGARAHSGRGGTLLTPFPCRPAA